MVICQVTPKEYIDAKGGRKKNEMFKYFQNIYLCKISDKIFGSQDKIKG